MELRQVKNTFEKKLEYTFQNRENHGKRVNSEDQRHSRLLVKRSGVEVFIQEGEES